VVVAEPSGTVVKIAGAHAGRVGIVLGVDKEMHVAVEAGRGTLQSAEKQNFLLAMEVTTALLSKVEELLQALLQGLLHHLLVVAAGTPKRATTSRRANRTAFAHVHHSMGTEKSTPELGPSASSNLVVTI
jgi:hypothetical protein